MTGRPLPKTGSLIYIFLLMSEFGKLSGNCIVVNKYGKFGSHLLTDPFVY